jgi:hypothetical protein
VREGERKVRASVAARNERVKIESGEERREKGRRLVKLTNRFCCSAHSKCAENKV